VHLPIRDQSTIATREGELIAKDCEPHVHAPRLHRVRQTGGRYEPNVIGVEELPRSGDRVLDPGVDYADCDSPVIEELESRGVARCYAPPGT
jgi:hypothetical protein